MYNRKAFDIGLYRKYDPKGKEVIKKYLSEYFALKPADNPDHYGVDVLEGILAFEPEMKVGWKDYNFPFPTLHIPERKRKYIKKGTYFVVVNEPCTRMAIVNSADIDSTIVKDTIYTNNERFFQIPLSKVTFVDVPGSSPRFLCAYGRPPVPKWENCLPCPLFDGDHCLSKQGEPGWVRPPIPIDKTANPF